MSKKAFDELVAAKNYLDEHLHLKNKSPKICLVLGSGLSHIANELKRHEGTKVVSYKDVPHFVTSTVEGHSGELVCGDIEGIKVLILSGRLHAYEGYKPDQVALPVRVAGMLGIDTFILTNASGAIADHFDPGHLMVIKDHINLTGSSPLVGPNIDELGPRFVDMSKAYDQELNDIAKNESKACDLTMHEGVYAGVLGPTYETPAEIAMFKSLGAHAVGMSTVYETIAIKHMNKKVLGISCLTNKAAGLAKEAISHDEVMKTNAQVAQKFGGLLKRIIKKIGSK